MIERKARWYHYFMLSFSVQMGITLLALLITGVQLFVYMIKEEDVVVFNDACEVTVGPTDEEGNVTRQGATMMCGDDKVNLNALEAPFLYQLLTTGQAPVIVCEKKVGEYLGDVSWDCKMDEV